jgi:hypothetical protein
MVDGVAGSGAGFSPSFFGFPLLIIIPPQLILIILICICPLKYAVALTRQHIIISSFFELGVSSLELSSLS